MSGQINTSPPSADKDLSTPDPLTPIPQSSPIRLAVLLSCLLHTAALFFPQLGSSARWTRPEKMSGQRSPSSLSVTLTPSEFIRGDAWHPPVDSPVPSELPGPEPIPVKQTADKSAERRMEGADILPLPGIVYYPTSFLTTRPQPLAEAELDPPSIRPIVASGKVVLTLWIDPQGATSKIVVERSNLPEDFANAAIVAFTKLRFTPGELYAQKVGTIMKVEVTYDDGRLVGFEIGQ